MRRIKTDVAVIGSGGAAMFAAIRLASQGVAVTVVNPADSFGVHDLRPFTGLGLWNAAYRAEKDVSLAELFSVLTERLREIFPAPMDESGLQRCEYLSVLSSTPVHRSVTDELEREFFRLERKEWSSGQFRLVNPEHMLVRARRLGLNLPHVAQLEGGVVRSYGLWWDAAKMGMHLVRHMQHRFGDGMPAGGSESTGERVCFTNARITGRYGRKLVIETRNGEEVGIECGGGIFVFLTGELLPHIKSMVAACEEPWIQGVRRRRRERHFAWFNRPVGTGTGIAGTAEPEKGFREAGSPSDESVWVQLGHTRYRWSRTGGMATWQSEKGPDGLERVVDEGLRLHSLPSPDGRFARAERAFRLEWDWKGPQWRATSHATHWATSFEGDIFSILELLWNFPRL